MLKDIAWSVIVYPTWQELSLRVITTPDLQEPVAFSPTIFKCPPLDIDKGVIFLGTGIQWIDCLVISKLAGREFDWVGFCSEEGNRGVVILEQEWDASPFKIGKIYPYSRFPITLPTPPEVDPDIPF